MAHLHLHNFNNNQTPNFLEGIGQKNKSVAQIAGSLKTIYEVGRDLAPVVAGVGAILL